MVPFKCGRVRRIEVEGNRKPFEMMRGSSCFDSLTSLKNANALIWSAPLCP